MPVVHLRPTLLHISVNVPTEHHRTLGRELLSPRENLPVCI
jgi:hypothetical protein